MTVIRSTACLRAEEDEEEDEDEDDEEEEEEERVVDDESPVTKFGSHELPPTSPAPLFDPLVLGVVLLADFWLVNEGQNVMV